MLLKLRLAHKGIAMILMVLAFELAFVGVLINLLQQAEYDVWRQSHAKSVLATVAYVQKDLALTALTIGFSATKPNNTNTERQADLIRASEKLTADFQSLSTLIGSDKSQHQALATLQKFSNKVLRVLDEQRDALEVPNTKLFSGLRLEEQMQIISEIAPALDSLSESEQRLVALMPEKQARSRENVVAWLCFGLAVNIVASIAVCLWIFRNITSRVDVLVQNSERLAAGKELYPVLPGHDEIAHLDQVFHSMAMALDEASKMRQDFITMASHDLRSPLTSINATLSMAAEGVYGDMKAPLASNLKLCQRTSERLIYMINDLLDAEKIDSGTFELSLDDYPVLPLITRAVECLSALAETANVEINMDVAPELCAYLDEQKLEQVIINLISNAIKYSPPNSTIEVKAEQIKEYVEITVADQGPGIPDHLQATIFERFRQLDNHRPGSGVGLYICQRIVELSGGTIGVESTIGKGTTFRLRLHSSSA
jgi:signal transduction histidine kinase